MAKIPLPTNPRPIKHNSTWKTPTIDVVLASNACSSPKQAIRSQIGPNITYILRRCHSEMLIKLLNQAIKIALVCKHDLWIEDAHGPQGAIPENY